MGLDTMDPSHPLCSTLKEIQQAAKRSAELTKQLLAFARKQTIAPEVLDLNETVESMLKMLRRLIGENIDLEWRPGKNLWRVKMDSILWLFPNGNKMIDDTFINLYYSR
jgi:C4-dicarboxylate-specific signal transduction histidine kinase